MNETWMELRKVLGEHVRNRAKVKKFMAVNAKQRRGAPPAERQEFDDIQAFCLTILARIEAAELEIFEAMKMVGGVVPPARNKPSGSGFGDGPDAA
jgi:hypothetical protein